MGTLFDHEDAKERAVSAAKIAASAEDFKALVGIGITTEATAAASARFDEWTRDVNLRALEFEWRSLGKEPVYTAGILLSPALMAYGEAQRYVMDRHIRETDSRRRKESGSGRE